MEKRAVTVYGYARVSTAAQDHQGQVAELTAAGCERIFAENASGANLKRPQLAKALAALQPGDVFTVTRLNRLARSTRDALNTLAAVTGKGAAFRSLREAWADTTTPAGRLAVVIYAGFAEFDREMILERTAEGRAAAMARGVTMGRPPTLSPRQRAFVLQARRADPPLMGIGQLAGLLKVSKATIKRAIKAGDPTPAEFEAYTGPQLDLEAAIAERSLQTEDAKDF